MVRVNSWGLKSILVSTIFLFLTHAAPAQTGSATIQGRVSDSQQLPMSQVAAVLQTPQGSAIQSVKSDDTGHYEVDSVAPGTYRITFSRAGFATVTKGPADVVSGQTLTLDATLQPADVSESVTVAG
jgi:hypothetical protein